MTLGLSEHIDLTMVLLYAFWIFFFGLVLYLNREGMREGFPVESEISGKPIEASLIGLPRPKIFKLREGGHTAAPHPENYSNPKKAAPIEKWSGAPLEPIGDPMLSEFGPSAYAERMDAPGLTFHGQLKIAPMRNLPEFEIADGDRDPRGLPVIAGDGETVGEVRDLWIDREEQYIRYIEVQLATPEGADAAAHRVLTPFTMARMSLRSGRMGKKTPEVRVRSIYGEHFPNVPRTASADQVTLLEEDKITAYYGGGTLYAHPTRREPLL